MPRSNKPTRELAADTAALAKEMAGREHGMASRIAAIVDTYFLRIVALVAQKPTYAEILVGLHVAHQAMSVTLQREFGRELDTLAAYAHRRAVNNVVAALPDEWLEQLVQTVRPEPLPAGIGVEKAAKALVFRPDEYRVGQVPVSLIRDTTRLGNPERIAATINRIRTNGGTAREVMKQVRPMVQGVKATVDRVVRDAGQLSTTLKNLEAWSKLGDFVLGYQVFAVPKTEFSRPEHLERSGTAYWKHPGANQLGLDSMPMPPYDREGGRFVLKHR